MIFLQDGKSTDSKECWLNKTKNRDIDTYTCINKFNDIFQSFHLKLDEIFKYSHIGTKLRNL